MARRIIGPAPTPDALHAMIELAMHSHRCPVMPEPCCATIG
jgi:hypothetical protein